MIRVRTNSNINIYINKSLRAQKLTNIHWIWHQFPCVGQKTKLWNIVTMRFLSWIYMNDSSAKLHLRKIIDLLTAGNRTAEEWFESNNVYCGCLHGFFKRLPELVHPNKPMVDEKAFFLLTQKIKYDVVQSWLKVVHFCKTDNQFSSIIFNDNSPKFIQNNTCIQMQMNNYKYPHIQINT